MPLPSEALPASALDANRAVARLRLDAQGDGGTTRLGRLHESGGYRIKFPDAGAMLEAVIVNTGGGLCGGDTLDVSVAASDGAQLVVTTQSAEKVYRASGPQAQVAVALTAGSGSRLHWMPQEAILFSGARLARSITAEVAEDGELLIAEATVFGRLHMGERPGAGLIADRWRIWRGGCLIHAEEGRLDGPVADLLDRPSVGGGARAMATLLLVAPDAEARLDDVRAVLDAHPGTGAASAWDGRLVVRLMADDPARLRAAYHSLVAALTGRPLPRYW